MVALLFDEFFKIHERILYQLEKIMVSTIDKFLFEVNWKPVLLFFESSMQ